MSDLPVIYGEGWGAAILTSKNTARINIF